MTGSATARTWPEVIADLEWAASRPAHNIWASPLLAFAHSLATSKFQRVFFPNVSIFNRQLYLVQTKDHDIARGVLCIQSDLDGSFEFTYQDTAVQENWWRRRCPPTAALAVLDRAVEHLHLVVRYE